MTATIDKLNVVLANANVLFTKLHNYHWHVKGPIFFEYHAKTEAYYNQFATMYDDVAERILQLEGRPLVTLKEILSVTTIEEETRTEFEVVDILNSLIRDFSMLHEQFSVILNAVETDDVTRSYADEQIGVLQKELWMLKSCLPR